MAIIVSEYFSKSLVSPFAFRFIPRRSHFQKLLLLLRFDIMEYKEIVPVLTRINPDGEKSGQIFETKSAFLGQNPGDEDVLEMNEWSDESKFEKAF